ncbi:hypothetical protein MPSEU_000290300 [Mayamaea pseudoterrestris]|nr:hypothetical protein MPSEU_000290300 [Mayamaea pseudoterrestris]
MKTSRSVIVATLLFVIAAVLGAVALLKTGKDSSSTTLASFSSSLLRRQLITLRVTGNNGSPSNAFPLGECQGDCDSDRDCASGLVCFQRSGTQSVPGCSGSSSNSGTDFCVRSSSSGGGGTSTGGSSLRIVGDNGSPSNVFPLGKCQGDCDSDSDCAGNLVCFERTGTQSVPGCSGSSSNSGKDFCVDPSSSGGTGGTDGSSGGGGNGRALKMYWQQGYYWQEETRERKWCMRCVNGSRNCGEGQGLEITNCDSSDVANWEFVSGPNGSRLIKLQSSNLCIRWGRWLILDSCDSSDSRQQFALPGSGSRFEIQPASDSNACVTQSHHPREGEDLGLWECRIPRGDTTNFWTWY